MKAAALAGAASLVATTGLLLVATSSSSAMPCPKNTSPHTYYVPGTGVGVAACKPWPEPGCDPGPCDPTAAAPRD